MKKMKKTQRIKLLIVIAVISSALVFTTGCLDIAGAIFRDVCADMCFETCANQCGGECSDACMYEFEDACYGTFDPGTGRRESRRGSGCEIDCDTCMMIICALCEEVDCNDCDTDDITGGNNRPGGGEGTGCEMSEDVAGCIGQPGNPGGGGGGGSNPSQSPIIVFDGLSMELDKETYAPGDTIVVTVRNLPRAMYNNGAFVSIYDRRAEHSEFQEFGYPETGTSILYFTAPNSTGRYEMRLYNQDDNLTDSSLEITVDFRVN